MISVRLDGIHLGATGVVTLQFSDGRNTEYANWAAVVAANTGLDQPGTDSEDGLKNLLISWWLAHDPGASDPATVEGKTITLDFLRDTPLTVG